MTTHPPTPPRLPSPKPFSPKPRNIHPEPMPRRVPGIPTREDHSP